MLNLAPSFMKGYDPGIRVMKKSKGKMPARAATGRQERECNKKIKIKKKYTPHRPFREQEKWGKQIIKLNVSTVSSYFKETLVVHILSF